MRLVNMVEMLLFRIFGILFIAASFGLQSQVPEACVQLPSRSTICDHQLYKRAPIDAEALGLKQGQMMCLCMADFNSLRIPVTQGIAATEQQVDLARAARSLGISEQTLLRLVRD